jgi:GntR family transcriptional regulator/MocR family aminotransferase
MVAPLGLAPKVARALSITGQSAPLLLHFIEQGHMARHLRRMRRIYAQRRQLFFELCEAELGQDLRLSQGDAGIQIAGLLTTERDDSAFFEEARRLGVNVSPLSMQYQHGGPVQALLLGYAACDEPTTRKGLRLLKIAFKGLVQLLVSDRRRRDHPLAGPRMTLSLSSLRASSRQTRSRRAGLIDGTTRVARRR